MKNIFKFLALSFVLIANVSAQENSELQTQEVSLEAAQPALIKSEKSALKAKFEQIKKWVKNNPKKSIAAAIPLAWWTANNLVFVYDFILNKKYDGWKDLGVRDIAFSFYKKKSLVSNFRWIIIIIPNLYIIRICYIDTYFLIASNLGLDKWYYKHI